jgi:hypothetical protein
VAGFSSVKKSSRIHDNGGNDAVRAVQLIKRMSGADA